MQPVVVARSCGMDHCRFQVAARLGIAITRIVIARIVIRIVIRIVAACLLSYLLFTS